MRRAPSVYLANFFALYAPLVVPYGISVCVIAGVLAFSELCFPGKEGVR